MRLGAWLKFPAALWWGSLTYFAQWVCAGVVLWKVR